MWQRTASRRECCRCDCSEQPFSLCRRSCIHAPASTTRTQLVVTRTSAKTCKFGFDYNCWAIKSPLFPPLLLFLTHALTEQCWWSAMRCNARVNTSKCRNREADFPCDSLSELVAFCASVTLAPSFRLNLSLPHLITSVTHTPFPSQMSEPAIPSAAIQECGPVSNREHGHWPAHGGWCCTGRVCRGTDSGYRFFFFFQVQNGEVSWEFDLFWFYLI